MINIDTNNIEICPDNRQEIEANRFARAIPINPNIIQSRYSIWAKEQGFNRWIVLGRISHDFGLYKFTSDESRNIN